MVDLVQVVKTEAPAGGLSYEVLHGAPDSFVPFLDKGRILMAIIKQHNEELPRQWLADLCGLWTPDFRLPGGHELKFLEHCLTVYGLPKPSSSNDSDHFYLAHSIELGLLVQFANPNPWRTKDVVGHSSAHNGHDEAFYAVHDSAELWLSENGKMPVRTQIGTGYTMGGTGFPEKKAFIVTKDAWHPVVAFKPAILLIHGPPEMVADQVNGTSFCHKNGRLFREKYADMLRNL
ncbi:hypothetical protein HYU17_00740 [Candidatus Woesearchaeota archaeon]|nr:hypothetical protein [Candidatus Woesearchaeota archaeon]